MCANDRKMVKKKQKINQQYTLKSKIREIFHSFWQQVVLPPDFDKSSCGKLQVQCRMVQLHTRLGTNPVAQDEHLRFQVLLSSPALCSCSSEYMGHFTPVRSKHIKGSKERYIIMTKPTNKNKTMPPPPTPQNNNKTPILEKQQQQKQFTFC